MSINMFTNFGEMANLKALCEAVAMDGGEQMQMLDPEHFSAYALSPAEIDPETMQNLVSVVDGSANLTPPSDENVPVAAPTTIDRLTASIVIFYITHDQIPIAVANICDPSKEDFHGYIPVEYYTLRSGYHLDGRLQLEFFAVQEDFAGTEVGVELKRQVASYGVPTFTVVDSTDKESINAMKQNGYKFVNSFEVDDSKIPVELWIDHADNVTPPMQDDTDVQPEIGAADDTLSNDLFV